MKQKHIFFLLLTCLFAMPGMAQQPRVPACADGTTSPLPPAYIQQRILDHNVVMRDYKLQPWRSLDTLMLYSVNYIKYCPERDTLGARLPWYLITSKLNEDGSFHANQNNQGGNLYFAMETFKRWYAYTGDRAALEPVLKMARHIMKYNTPKDWAWPQLPRTQDDTPDGQYTDEKGELDKQAMVALAYIDLTRFTGDKTYFRQAEHIARVLMQHVTAGDAEHSPLPFRINLRTGKVRVPYTSNMIFFVRLADELLKDGTSLRREELQQKRQLVLDWIMRYPMQTNFWTGYFEDVNYDNPENVTQLCALETARYLEENPQAVIDAQQHIVDLIAFCKLRFGQTTRYGATSICEQDGCCYEMGSHTARYASVVARWYDMCGDERMREEARAATALCSYSMMNRYSPDTLAYNNTGVGYLRLWYSDSYFDFLTHILDVLGNVPELVPDGVDHLIRSTSMITDIKYARGDIKYTARDTDGTERLRLTFRPKVYADGKPLPQRQWSFGKWRGVDNVLIIHRQGVRSIEIRS